MNQFDRTVLWKMVLLVGVENAVELNDTGEHPTSTNGLVPQLRKDSRRMYHIVPHIQKVDQSQKSRGTLIVPHVHHFSPSFLTPYHTVCSMHASQNQATRGKQNILPQAVARVEALRSGSHSDDSLQQDARVLYPWFISCGGDSSWLFHHNEWRVCGHASM